MAMAKAVVLILSSFLIADSAHAGSIPKGPFKDCTLKQAQMLVDALQGVSGKYQGARARVDRAWVAAKSTAESGRGKRARQAHKAVFKTDLPPSSVEMLQKIYAALGKLPPMVCEKEGGPFFAHCGTKDAMMVTYEDKRRELRFCPKYFEQDPATGPENRVRRLIHEASHLAGVAEVAGESYCFDFDCKDACADGRATGGTYFDVADNWSQFIHCAAGEKPDEGGDVISAPTK